MGFALLQPILHTAANLASAGAKMVGARLQQKD
jgi:hypothetical protein